jgi:hypothetical protein|tara:strand:- start:13824 stop:14342 length:519 start_codon:yes stop_codon:yes gene_type:complete
MKCKYVPSAMSMSCTPASGALKPLPIFSPVMNVTWYRAAPGAGACFEFALATEKESSSLTSRSTLISFRLPEATVRGTTEWPVRTERRGFTAKPSRARYAPRMRVGDTRVVAMEASVEVIAGGDAQRRNQRVVVSREKLFSKRNVAFSKKRSGTGDCVRVETKTRLKRVGKP